jgi:hypothetical protein
LKEARVWLNISAHDLLGEELFEAVLSKRSGDHSCLQTRERYRKLMGDVQERRVSQDEFLGKQWTRISSISLLPLTR